VFLSYSFALKLGVCSEKSELIPTLLITDNWILLTHPLRTGHKSQPPFKESQRIARAQGKCSRHKRWWREGKDELATHSMTTEVWISTKGQIPEATWMAIQEALKRATRLMPPHSGWKTSRSYTCPAQKQASLAYTTFQEQYSPQTGRTTRGQWELATSDWTNTEVAAASWEEARKATPLTGLN